MNLKFLNEPSGGGRKYNIALVILAFNSLALFGDKITDRIWLIATLAVGAGYGLVNVAQKRFKI